MENFIPLNPWQKGDYLQANNDHLTIDGVDTLSLVEQYGSPLFVFSEKKLKSNAQAIISAFQACHNNTSVCYAAKACSNIGILKLLKDEGVQLEINSAGELHKAKTAGFIGEQIVLNGVAKMADELRAAIEYQIKAINVDSISELEKIIDVARECQIKANVTLRIVPQIKGGGVAGWETGSSSSKFGMTREEINQAIKLVKHAEDAIILKGFHAHIGSQVTNIDAYQQEAEFMIGFLGEISADLPYPLQHINVGGGFPKKYIANEQLVDRSSNSYKDMYYCDTSFEDISTLLLMPLTSTLGPDIEIIVEPGRSMVSDTAILLTSVEAEKNRENAHWLYLDAGYSVLFDIFTSWYFHTVTANRAEDVSTKKFKVAGPLCDSHDVLFDMEGEAHVQSLIAADPSLEEKRALLERTLVHQPSERELPANTNVGDTIAFFDVGAYGLESMNHYCGRLRPAAALVNADGASKLIRRRDTLKDLTSHDVF